MADETKKTEDRVEVGDSIGIEVTRAPTDDEVQVEDNVKIELFGPDGEKKDERSCHNLVTTVGKGGFAECLLASPSSPTKPTHMGVGTGTNAAAVGDTALQTELSTRVAFTSKTRSGAVITYVGDYAAGIDTGAITEAGIFDASSSGNLYNRAVFAVINKGAGDTLKITWQTTFS